MNEFGKKIEFLRKQNNATIKTVADILKISSSYYRDIEKGNRNPLKEDKIKILSEFYQYDFEELYQLSIKYNKKIIFKLEGKSKKHKQFIIKFIRKIKYLDDQQIEEIAKILK